MQSPESSYASTSDATRAAVSQLLLAIDRDVGDGELVRSDSPFRIIVCADRETRERAYRLAQRVYRSRGFVRGDGELCVSSYDGDPRTLTLLAVDSDGNDAGTMTLVIDSAAGLPCDEIFAPEMNRLRRESRHLAEVTRLAIDDRHQGSKMLLVRLINQITIYGRHVVKADNFVIEVNPRHGSWYQRLLGFEVLGASRPCPRVLGAPAVLLSLDMHYQDREIRRLGGLGSSVRERSLYPYFLPWSEEPSIAARMALTHPGVNASDASSFGLKQLARA